MSKKVTLIMTCYNKEQYIDVMLASVYGQLHDDIELICVDDGSTDGTRAKLDAWQPMMEERGYSMVIVSKENGGAPSAINAGLSILTGDYVCFPDADDIMMPGYASEMIAYLEAKPSLQWVKCDAFKHDNSEVRIPVIYSEVTNLRMSNNSRYLFERCLAHRIFWPVWSLMIRTDFFRKCIPNMRIEDSMPGAAAQTLQILLPLAFRENYEILHKPLYFHVERDDGAFRKRTYASYTQAIAYEEAKYDIAKRVIKKLSVGEDKVAKWYAIIDTTLGMTRVSYADRNKETKLKTELIHEQLKRIHPVFGNCFKMQEDILDDFPIWHFTQIALDRLIYTQEELQAHITLDEKMQNSRIFLYGAGAACRMLLPLLILAGMKPECIWDKNASATQSDIYGVPVLPPRFNQLTTEEKETSIVIISISKTEYVKEAENFLKESGFTQVLHDIALQDLCSYIAANQKED